MAKGASDSRIALLSKTGGLLLSGPFFCQHPRLQNTGCRRPAASVRNKEEKSEGQGEQVD